jgi:hypothetical protein
MSEWPLRYLVAECMTRSIPISSGFWIQGVAKVLSQTVRIPRSRPMRAAASRSTSFNKGLVGVSIQIIRVSGRKAFSRAAGSLRSADEKLKPAELARTWWNSRCVPP